MLLTRSPLGFKEQAPFHLGRLAGIRHAASVHPEPGSNSQCLYSSSKLLSGFCKLKNWRLLFVHLFSFQRSVPCLLLRNRVPSQDCTLEYTITIDNYQSTTFSKIFNVFFEFSFLYKNRRFWDFACAYICLYMCYYINVATPSKNPPVKRWVIELNKFDLII